MTATKMISVHIPDDAYEVKLTRKGDAWTAVIKGPLGRVGMATHKDPHSAVVAAMHARSP